MLCYSSMSACAIRSAIGSILTLPARAGGRSAFSFHCDCTSCARLFEEFKWHTKTPKHENDGSAHTIEKGAKKTLKLGEQINVGNTTYTEEKNEHANGTVEIVLKNWRGASRGENVIATECGDLREKTEQEYAKSQTRLKCVLDALIAVLKNILRLWILTTLKERSFSLLEADLISNLFLEKLKNAKFGALIATVFKHKNGGNNVRQS